MKIQWKTLILCLVIPLGVGGLAALLTMGTMREYATLNQPPLAPPGWLFPVVWTILYLLMGYASYLVVTAQTTQIDKRHALTAYGAQLLANFLWPLVFFGLKWYLFAFLWLVLLWGLIYITIRRFSDIRELAGDLLLPYILWVTFAGYLNLGVYILN